VSGHVLVDETGYAAPAALASLVAHAVPGLERVDPVAGSYQRLVSAAGAVTQVTATFAPGRVLARADLASGGAPEVESGLRTVVRQWLDLDTDIGVVENHLRRDPALDALVRRQAGLRIVGSLDGFASAVMTVLGQQVSLAAGRTFGGRLVARWGRQHESGLIEFPSPAELAEADPVELAATVGLTTRRGQTVVALARTCAAGLALEPGRNIAPTRSALMAVPGIGPWTVDYLSLRVLRDGNALPAGDLVLRRALGLRTSAEVERRALDWAPHRAYAVAHLWHRAAYAESTGT
jgi:3-methyladenine DNA glycosylase/8-oxoguanine DNA glycosylase